MKETLHISRYAHKCIWGGFELVLARRRSVSAKAKKTSRILKFFRFDKHEKYLRFSIRGHC